MNVIVVDWNECLLFEIYENVVIEIPRWESADNEKPMERIKN